MDFVIPIVQLDQLLVIVLLVFLATLLVLPVLDILVNVHHAQAAVVVFLISNVLVTAQLELSLLMELVNIVLTLVLPALEAILLVLPAQLVKFFTTVLAMLNALT
jgi:hypothetical protein